MDAKILKDETMVVIRWFAVLLLAAVFGLGCGEKKPDTDPSDAELKEPNIDSGDSKTEKSGDAK